MKETLTIALCQCSPFWEDVNANHIMFENYIASVADNVDLIVLPEMFTTGFTMNPSRVAQPMSGDTVNWMNAQANQYNTVIVGSVVIEEDGKFFNRMIWAIPHTSPVHYDKKHLFSFAGEHHHYHVGDQQVVVDIKGWKFASFICFDLRFPVWCRNTDQNHYDVALFIASWPKVRAPQWNALLRARAIENQAYVVAVNRIGEDGNGIDYNGDSQLVDALGNVLAHEIGNESIKIVTLEKSHIHEIRTKFPFLREADPHILLQPLANDTVKAVS